MSTPRPDNQFPDAEIFRNLVSREYTRLRNSRLTAIISIAVAVFLATSSLGIALESFFYLSSTGKTIIWIAIAGVTAATAFLLNRYYQTESFKAFYRRFTAVHELHPLRHTLDLLENSRGDTSPLREAALRQNQAGLNQDEISEHLQKFISNHQLHKLKIAGRSSLAAGAALLLIPLLFASDSTQRYAQFWSEFERPIPYDFTVEPGNTTIEQGGEFEMKIRFDGNIPDEMQMAMRTEEESDFRRRSLEETEDGVFAAPGVELFNDLFYYVELDGYESEQFLVEVEQLPRLRDLTVEVHPPEYTGLESESYTYPFSRIEAFPGSELRIEALPNKALTQAQYFSAVEGDSIDLSPAEDDDSLLTASHELMEADTLGFYLEDEYELTNRNGFNFEIELREDRSPTAEILSPEQDLTLSTAMPVDLVYEITDDFGFTAVSLHYELNKAYVDEPITGSVDLEVPAGTEAIEDHEWDLDEIGLSSMDRLTYWIEVSDNNVVTGPQTSESAPQTISIQSLAEQLTEQDERERDMSESFDQIQEQYNQFRDEMDRFRQEVRENPDDDWEQSQILDEMQDQREGIDQEVEDLQREFDELTQELEQRGNLSEDTRQMYEELSDLISEIDDPDLMQQLQELQENLQDMDQSQLREALDEFEFDEDRYRDRLERTVELFKQLRLNADLDNMAQLMEDLGMQEQDIIDSEELGDEEVRQQESIREEMENISEKLDGIGEDGPDRHQEHMQQFEQEMTPQIDELKDQLDQNIEQMQQDGADQDQMRQDQQEMRDQMQQLSDTFNETRESMQQEQIEVNIASLKTILGGLIQLSTTQEEVTLETAELSDNSPAFVDQARRQRNIGEQFNQFTDSLRQVASEVPQFPNQVSDRQREVQRYIEHATDYLVDRDGSRASSAERNALGEMNRLSSLLADLIDQLEDQMNGGGGGDMSMEEMVEQMQEMSQDQQELNQQIDDFINDLQGERLTQDEMERLEQIAEQQNRIREQLEELQRRGGLDSGDEALSEMERINEEMEETIRELRGGQTDEIMVERQQNILSRMLETEESMQQRDEDEEERAGETAEEYEAGETSDFTIDELRQYLRSSIEEAEQTRFSEDYQRLIEAYFRLLETEMEEELPEEEDE